LALKRAGRQRSLDVAARDIQAALGAGHLTAPASVIGVFAATTRAALSIIVRPNRGLPMAASRGCSNLCPFSLVLREVWLHIRSVENLPITVEIWSLAMNKR
jgi:hypothetical protein